VVLADERCRGLSTALRFGRDDGLVWMVDCIVVGEAGGADAGLVVEGWDFEAGVVGEDEEVGGGQGIGDGFEIGVALEGGGVFDGFGDLLEVGEGEDLDAGGAGAGGEFGQLAGVGGGGVEGHETECRG